MGEAVKSPLEMFYKWEKETPNKVFLRQPKNWSGRSTLGRKLRARCVA